MRLRRKKGLRHPRKPRQKGATPKQRAAARRNILKAQLSRIGLKGRLFKLYRGRRKF